MDVKLKVSASKISLIVSNRTKKLQSVQKVKAEAESESINCDGCLKGDDDGDSTVWLSFFYYFLLLVVSPDVRR